MFFDQQMQDVARRQQQLQARSAVLRERLGHDVQVLRTPLAVADQVRSGWHWLKRHPEAVGGAVLLLAVLRPRRMWRLASRLWTGWQLWRRLQDWRAGLDGKPGDRRPGLGAGFVLGPLRHLLQNLLSHQPRSHSPGPARRPDPAGR